MGQIPLPGVALKYYKWAQTNIFKKSQNIDFERSSNVYVSLENIESWNNDDTTVVVSAVL